MNSGIGGTYQAAKNGPVDTATFDTVQFDTRFILVLQLGLSVLVTAGMIVVTYAGKASA